MNERTRNPMASKRGVRSMMTKTVLIGGALLLALAGLAGPAAAQIEGISFTLEPTLALVRWNDKVGLEDTELFGGRLGLNLGPYASLQGFYLARNDVDTRLGGLGLVGLEDADFDFEQQVDLRTYGADVLLDLAQGEIVPFIKGGGGVLRLNPDVGPTLDQISWRWGGGVRFGIERFMGTIFVQDLAFRLDRAALAAAPEGVVVEDTDAHKLRHNLEIGFGLDFNLGGVPETAVEPGEMPLIERLQYGLAGFSIPIEPFAGRLDFRNGLGIRDQDLIGVRTGFDFNRYFGLEGYYWRGVNDEFSHTERIESWGAEGNFHIAPDVGIDPFLLAGIGELKFMSGFSGFSGAPTTEVRPDDRTMLILGGGIQVPVSENFELTGTARDYLFSTRADLGEVSSTQDLRSNWMFSGGINFLLGGHAYEKGIPEYAGRERLHYPEYAPTYAYTEPEPYGYGTADNVYYDSATGLYRDRLTGEPVEEPYVPASEPYYPTSEQYYPTSERYYPTNGPYYDHSYTGQMLNAANDRIVAFPAPAAGEVYVRYGAPGAVSIRTQTRTTSRDESDVTSMAEAESARIPSYDEYAYRPSYTNEQLDRMADSIVERLDQRISRLENQVAAQQQQQQAYAPYPAPAYTSPMPCAPGYQSGYSEQYGYEEPYGTPQMTYPAPQPYAAPQMTYPAPQPYAAPETTYPAPQPYAAPQPSYAPPQQYTTPQEQYERERGPVYTGPETSYNETPYEERNTTIEERQDAGAGRPQFSLFEPEAVRPYAGMNVNDPEQGVVGLRLNLGPLTSTATRTFLVPEVAFGFGSGGVSFLGAANIRYAFNETEFEQGAWSPYVLAGAGIEGFSNDVNDKPSRHNWQGVVDLGAGISVNLKAWSASWNTRAWISSIRAAFSWASRRKCRLRPDRDETAGPAQRDAAPGRCRSTRVILRYD